MVTQSSDGSSRLGLDPRWGAGIPQTDAWRGAVVPPGGGFNPDRLPGDAVLVVRHSIRHARRLAPWSDAVVGRGRSREIDAQYSRRADRVSNSRSRQLTNAEADKRFAVVARPAAAQSYLIRLQLS